MSNKDWLDNITTQLINADVFINENGNKAVEVSLSVLNRLIEQAEGVQELEYRNTVIENRNYELEQKFKDYQEVNKNMYDMCGDFKFENLKLEQQNKRYRETIKKATDILDDFERYGNKCATKAYITLIEALESESNA